MTGRKSLCSMVTLLAGLITGTTANRRCGSSAAAVTFQWTLSDWRLDGADPSKKGSLETISAVLSPGSTRTLFSCHVEWPETWNGNFNGSGPLVWTSCEWTGPGANVDGTVSFGMDMNSKTAYVAHTYTCDDAPMRG